MDVVFYRSVIMLLVVFTVLRLMGKRQLGQLELSELVVAVMLSDFAVAPVADTSKSIFHGIIPLLVLLFFELLFSKISFENVHFRAMFAGKPSILVKNGVINQSEMRRNKYTTDELVEQLRRQSITDLSTLKYAILEVDGTLNTILSAENQPLTFSTRDAAPLERGLPIIIINNGRIMSENLKVLGLDENWLAKQLEQRDIKNPKSVYLMLIDEAGGIYFARRS